MRHTASTFKTVKQGTIWYKMRMQKPSYQASKNNHFVYHNLTTSPALQNRSNRQKEPVNRSSSQCHRCRRQRESNQTNTPLSLHPSQPKHNTTKSKTKPNLFFNPPHPNQTKQTALLLPQYKKMRKQENASCHSRRKWE